MKRIAIITTAALFLILGIAGLAYAQHEDKGENRDHAEQQKEHRDARPAPRQEQHAQQQRQDQNGRQQEQHAQQQRQDQNGRQQEQHAQQQRQDQNGRQQEQHAQQQRQDQNGRQQQQRAQQQRSNGERGEGRRDVHRSAWQEHRSQNWQSDHRNWQQRGGYRGYRIPDDRFRVRFGSGHPFRIHGRPFLVVGGYPRFRYGGYWITTVDPWPEYWGNDWYDNDDVYVVYQDDGYYLYNRRYPQTGITINISM